MSIVFYLLLAFLLYNFIFRFALPLYRTTRRVRRTFREMQEQMHGQRAGGTTTTAPAKPDPAAGKGEYIDFEEVKD